MRTRVTFRGIVVAVALAALGGAVSGLVNLNVQHYARGTPLEALLDLLRQTMLRLREITTDPRFLIATALLVGGALFLSADALLRRWAAWRDANRKFKFKNINRRLLAMTAVLIFGSGLVLSIMWLAIESRFKSPVAVATPSINPLTQELENARTEIARKNEQIVSITTELENERKKQPAATPQPQSSFATTYVISPTDIRNIRDEIFKVRGSLPDHMSIQTADDTLARGVATGLSKGVGFGGINMDGMSVGYPITPQETGISIRVGDLGKIPEDAKYFADALKKALGVEPRYTAMQGMALAGFRIFVGTNPNEN